ncbi:MAG: sugar phosphate nucleotidyltransferase [bacterium]
MSKEIEAVILAGGRGERMGDITRDRQKCLLPVEGKPILGHILDNIQDAFGSAHLVIATGHRGETIKEAFGERYRNIQIEYVHDPAHLETRKRLQLAENTIRGPFLYLAGDVIADANQLTRIAETYEKEKSGDFQGVISAATDHQPALSHAIISAQNGHAIEMIYPATPTWSEGQVREMGIAYYANNFFYRLRQARPEQTYLSHVITEAIGQGVDFAVEKYFDRWYHFGTPKDLQAKIQYNRGIK